MATATSVLVVLSWRKRERSEGGVNVQERCNSLPTVADCWDV